MSLIFFNFSGQCYHDCPQGQIEVPYGTNFPGQTVCYRTQRPGLEEGFGQIESCAPQLTQSAHTALQLPYTIFGLGLAPNFLDYMFVNVTNATDHSRGHTWSQVRPDFIYKIYSKDLIVSRIFCTTAFWSRSGVTTICFPFFSSKAAGSKFFSTSVRNSKTLFR